MLIFALEIYGNINVRDFIGIRAGIFPAELKLCFIILYSESEGLRLLPEVKQFK